MTDQVPFGAVSFAENPDPRCPCVLLLDTSGSMAGLRIAELNAGIAQYREELASDSIASRRVDLALVTFGGTVQTVHEFGQGDFFPPHLEASGGTPMGEAILRAVEMLARRKASYQENGIMFYRPWIFLITDGAPTDEWAAAAARIHEGERAKSFMFFSVGVDGADMNVLGQLGTREPLRLQGLRFRELFTWLSNSQKAVSRSKTSDRVSLENPTTGPSGWAIAG